MKKQITILFLLILITACKENKETSATTHKETKSSKAAVQISFEGELHTIKQEDLQPNIVDNIDNEIRYSIWQDGNPIQLNFNIKNDILEKGSGVYNIPEDNSPKIKADLNFFNSKRKVSSITNKRIIFRKGKIIITQLTEHKLEMTFDGEGSGMRERDKSFPISGKVNINF